MPIIKLMYTHFCLRLFTKVKIQNFGFFDKAKKFFVQKFLWKDIKFWIYIKNRTIYIRQICRLDA